MFYRLLQLESDFEKADYHDGTEWDFEALKADLFSLGGAEALGLEALNSGAPSLVEGFVPSLMFAGIIQEPACSRPIGRHTPHEHCAA